MANTPRRHVPSASTQHLHLRILQRSYLILSDNVAISYANKPATFVSVASHSLLAISIGDCRPQGFISLRRRPSRNTPLFPCLERYGCFDSNLSLILSRQKDARGLYSTMSNRPVLRVTLDGRNDLQRRCKSRLNRDRLRGMFCMCHCTRTAITFAKKNQVTAVL